MSNRTVSATAEGLSTTQAVLPPLYREHLFPVEAARVKALASTDLTIVYDAFTLAGEVLLGVINQPRTKDDLHDWLEDEMERCSTIRGFAVEELERRPATGDRSDEDRIGLIAAWELRACGGDPLEVAEKLLRFHREMMRAKSSTEQVAR